MAENRAAAKAAEEILFSAIPEEERKQKTPFLENRGLAIVLTAAAILLGLLIGTHRSVAAQARQVERGFENGVQYEGFSILGDLADRMEYAQSLAKIALRYGLNDEAAAVSKAVEALYGEAHPGVCYDANFELTGAVEALNGAMLREGLSAQDEKYRGEYYRNFISCNDTISHEAVVYNRLADEFNEKILNAFPTGTLAKLTGVGEVEAYR